MNARGRQLAHSVGVLTSLQCVSTVGSPSDGSIRPTPALTLKTLRPVYDASSHQLYVDLIVADLTSKSPSTNVAVSGAYGTGKSSVLAGLLAELKRESIPAIQVTLATLNQSREALLEVSGEDTLTAALEKEVVKRLLYSAKPADIPRSRFNRISQFRFAPAIGLGVALSGLLNGVAYTFGTKLPADRIVHAWHWWSSIGPVLSLIGVAGLIVGLQAALSSFRLSQIAVGPATLSLDDENGNYFDHYLDEIVYFFQKTKMKVVIFEDLDRFDDAGIFLALRELNNLLNASPQIEDHVTFIYAIRDSLFVAAAETTDHEGGKLPDAHARHGSDTAASDRAKFFDLIVPLVPFISHEVAADLLVLALADLSEDLRPSRPLLSLCGTYFTDMRVLHSIRNEYAVFASELLGKSSVRGLQTDHLFAMILYKHLHLDDFERLRTGTSLLDASVDAIRRSTSEMLLSLEATIATAEDAIERADSLEKRARSAGERLSAKIGIVVRSRGWQPAQSLVLDGTRYGVEELFAPDFWEAIGQAGSLAIQIQTPNGPYDLPAAEVQELLGGDRNPQNWARSAVQRDKQWHARLIDAKEWLRSASFSKLLVGPFPGVGPEEGWAGPGDACRKVLGPGLPYELLRRGYLDQNFALYTTKFHGELLSADARSFLMQYVDRHRSEPLFKLSADDVDEILERAGDSLLSDDSALNVSIVDRLLETGDRLPEPLESEGRAEDFVVVYLAEGRQPEWLLQRLVGKRSDILDLISAAPATSGFDRRRFLSVCLAALSDQIEYQTSSTTVEALVREFSSMPMLQEELAAETAAAVADLAANNGIWVSDLSSVAQPLRAELAAAGCFAVTRRSLDSIASNMGGIGLDALGGMDDGVGRYLLSSFSEYATALRQEPSKSLVSDPANLDAVVRGILAVDQALLPEALALVPDGVAYEMLADAPAEAYPDLARAAAFTTTRENITQYVETVGGVDAPLAECLSRAGAIAVSESSDDDEEAARQSLAQLVVLSDELEAPAKVSLVVSLKTDKALPVAPLNLVDPAVARGLLGAGEIGDTATTFTTLASGPWPVFEACAAVSSKFDEFLSEVPFTDSLLASTLESRIIRDSTKAAVLSRFDHFGPALAGGGSKAWVAAAQHLGVALTVPQMKVLAGAGASTQQLVAFVRANHHKLDLDDLVALLQLCGEPYSGLGVADGSHFNIPYSDALRSILQTLKKAGLVKEFHKKRLQALFEVQMGTAALV